MSAEGADVVVAPRSAERARFAGAGALGRPSTTSRPGTTRAPPVFHGSFAAWVSTLECGFTIDGAPIAAGDDAISGGGRSRVRARQAAIRARNEVSFRGADREGRHRTPSRIAAHCTGG